MDLKDLDKFEIEDLKEIATKLGVPFTGNMKAETLRPRIAEHIEQNPDCLGDKSDEEKLKAEEEAKLEAKLEADKNNLDGAQDQLAEIERLEKVIADAQAKILEIDKTAKISMKSKFRGVINTSVGAINFGTDGEATVTARQAQFLSKMNGYDIC